MRATGGVSPPVVSRYQPTALLAVLVFAASCGGGSQGASESSASPATSATTTTVTAATTTSSPPSSETTAAQPEQPDPLDVQGHRGARGLKPENTLPAFEVALDAGVNTLELDLHFTMDGQVVVWHDPIVPTDKCEIADSAEVASLGSAIATLSRDELGAFRCAKNPDSGRFPDQTASPTPIAGDNYSIVTLGELFDFVAAYAESELKTAAQRQGAEAVEFNVETKRLPDRPVTINDGFDGETPGPFELAILETVVAKELQDRVTIQSFDHRSLRAIRALDESIQLAALTRRNEPFDAEFADFAQIWSPDYRSLSAAGLNEAQDAGMLVIPWTVNETSDMNRLIDLGVDGLITDRPDLLIQEISGRA